MKAGSLLIVVTVTIAAAAPAFGITVVPAGNVSGTWTADGTPYAVQGPIAIGTWDTLAIGPGVDVVFLHHDGLTVCGNLQAVGTEADSIRFDAVDTEIGWTGITFFQDGGGRIEHAAVQHVRSDVWGVSAITICSSGHVDIVHSAIRDNDGYAGGGVFLDQAWGADLTLSRCSISHNNASYAGGGIFGGGTCTIEYCVIAENLAYGSEYDSGGGARIDSQYDPVVFDHCTFSRNEGWYGEGLTIFWSSLVTVANCIFEGHPGLALGNSSYNTVVSYCDFYNNLSDVACLAPPGFGVLVQANANGDSCDVYHDIFLDPLFCDPDAENLSLAANSPCRDAG